MAVIKCSECGGQVSTSAKSCPHCGAVAKKFKKPSSSLGTVLLWIVGIGIVASIFGDGERETNTASSTAGGVTATPKPAVSRQEVAVVKPSVPAKSVCKAAVATIMGRPVSIISATEKAGGEVALSYTRADDGSVWKYKCKLDGDRAIWAAEGGRWRTHPDDGVVKFSVDGSSVEVTESYGGDVATSKRFSLSEL